MNNLIYNTQYLFQHFLKERNCEYFNIPEYQRGYKWTSNNVMQLLDDLYNFSKKRNNEEFYCLQNITLTKESVEGKTYMNVIDGQQRLTTLFIILSFMQRNLADKIIPVDSNIFKYSVRDSTNKFLKEKIQTGYLWMSDIEPNDAESKDQFYIMEVAKSVKEWFDNHPNELYPDIILNHIKLIVNEVKSGEEETVFASLNGGKVDLDGADLVRAILITRAARQKYPTIISQKTINQFTNDDIDFNINIKVSSNGKIHEYRVKLGVEIDKMNLWWSQKDVRAYFEQLLPNRIERNRSFNYSDYPIDLLYYAFFEAFKSTLFNEQEKNRDLNLKHFENGIDFNSRPGDDHLELYKELQELHLTLVDWYNDSEIYNLVGYLMYNFKSDIITFELLYKIWKDVRGKADFKEKIKRLIRYQLASLYGEMERGEINLLSILNGDINEALEENLRNLRKDILNTSTMNWYNSDITLKLLPLLDILPHTIQKGKKTNKVIKPLKQQYFKRTPSEDKEHVRSQTRQLDEESMTQEDVELLIEENRRGLNSIGNIVLLHESINKSYKNKKLIMKMVRIYSEHLMDDVNAYIRPHTLDVFMSKMRNINENGIDEDEIFWSDEDIKRTAISIDSSLADYLSFPELTDNKKLEENCHDNG